MTSRVCTPCCCLADGKKAVRRAQGSRTVDNKMTVVPLLMLPVAKKDYAGQDSNIPSPPTHPPSPANVHGLDHNLPRRAPHPTKTTTDTESCNTQHGPILKYSQQHKPHPFAKRPRKKVDYDTVCFNLSGLTLEFTKHTNKQQSPTTVCCTNITAKKGIKNQGKQKNQTEQSPVCGTNSAYFHSVTAA